MRAGAAKVDITPTKSLFLDGYSARRKKAFGMKDPLHAKALTLSCGGVEAAIITLDLTSFPKSFVEAVRSKVEERLGIPKDHILLNASHTHFAPILDTMVYDDGVEGKPDEEWVEALQRKVVGTVEEASSKMKEVKVGFGKGSCPTIGVNRRVRLADGRVQTLWWVKEGEKIVGPGGPADPDVSVLYFEGLDGKPVAVLFSYACHATIGGLDPEDKVPAYLYSASYPGYAMELIERVRPGIVALFAQGTGGNITPRTQRYRYTFEEAARLGRVLGYECLKTIEEIDVSLVSDPLKVERVTVDLPCRQRLNIRGEPLKVDPGSVRTELQAFKIGRTVILALPSEVCVEIGLEIKEKSPIKELIVLGYCNHFFWYVPTTKIIEEGGYEARYSQIKPGADRILIEESLKLVKRLA